MNLSRLIDHAKTDLPSSVHLERGKGDQPCLRVAGRGGSAEIYLQGAHLTSWRPVGQEPVIWASRASAYSPGAPIRGGIPICFPWFGPNIKEATAPLHGFARLHDWSLLEATVIGDDVSLTFALSDSEQTRSTAWPFRFEASYRVVIGTSLHLSLEITNRDTHAVAFEEVLHTYFAVDDVRDVAIRGLTGASYLDRTGPAEPVQQGAEPVRVEKETDRMYLDSTGTVTIEDSRPDVHHRRRTTAALSMSPMATAWGVVAIQALRLECGRRTLSWGQPQATSRFYATTHGNRLSHRVVRAGLRMPTHMRPLPMMRNEPESNDA